MFSIETLEKLETISALKVLLYFTNKTDENGVIKISINSIIDDSDLPRNSVKRGIKELLDNGLLEQIATGKGNQPNTYKVPKISGPKVDSPKVDTQEIQGYKKAVGAKISDNSGPKVDPTNNIYNNIKELKDKLLSNDINSLSVVNDNIYLTDKELGSIAKKLLDYWYVSIDDGKRRAPVFFSSQMKVLKDLLVTYRTEQVFAGIEYWTNVNPPTNKMQSLVWLKYNKNNTNNMMRALDYYKQQYINKQSEIEEELRKSKVETMKQRALEIAKEKADSKKKVDETTDNDFINDLLSGLGKLKL